MWFGMGRQPIHRNHRDRNPPCLVLSTFDGARRHAFSLNGLDSGHGLSEPRHAAGSVKPLGRGLKPQLEQLFLRFAQFVDELLVTHFAKFNRLGHV